MTIAGIPVRKTQAGYVVSTEMGTTLFGLVAGVGGAIANLVAGQRLTGYEDDWINLGTIALPVAISIVASAGAAFLLPSGG